MDSNTRRSSDRDSDTCVRLSRPDKSIVGDPQVLENLRVLEDKYPPPPNNLVGQRDLQPYMRKMVAHWMVEVCESENCHEDVLVAAINYLDRTLAVVYTSRARLQLLAAACMLIASKFKDTQSIGAPRLVMYTDHSITTSQLLDMELLVLNALKWELSCAGPYDFLDQFLFHLSRRITEEERSTLRRHAATLIVMCSVESEFSVSPPSLISSACLCAAAGGVKGVTWCKKIHLQTKLCMLTSIDKESLNHCQELIEERLKLNMADEARSAMEGNNVSTPQKSHQSTSRVPTTPTDVRDIIL